MTLNTQQLIEIFYSGPMGFRGDRVLIAKVLFLLESNYLIANRNDVCAKKKYIALAENEEVLAAHPEAAGGGDTHVALKLIAQEYLAKSGIQSDIETSFCGYRPDVLSKDKRVVIECGHTDNVDKIFTYFTQGHITKFIQIPYPFIEDDYVYSYEFVPQHNLHEFLEYEKTESLNDVRSLIKKR